ncbi:hypothetical protein GCM10010365_42530 [Streptomyces poonensis]|uniref:Uncharacterized protein n=1 Tax=Streptomyces poonensis TaxID=68255 RepID=A0A918PP16_9ACTN|nr:hypothetical protein GCM10010365_42530 [Streptomyces poonensis]
MGRVDLPVARVGPVVLAVLVDLPVLVVLPVPVGPGSPVCRRRSSSRGRPLPPRSRRRRDTRGRPVPAVRVLPVAPAVPAVPAVVRSAVGRPSGAGTTTG